MESTGAVRLFKYTYLGVCILFCFQNYCYYCNLIEGKKKTICSRTSKQKPKYVLSKCQDLFEEKEEMVLHT